MQSCILFQELEVPLLKIQVWKLTVNKKYPGFLVVPMARTDKPISAPWRYIESHCLSGAAPHASHLTWSLDADGNWYRLSHLISEVFYGYFQHSSSKNGTYIITDEFLFFHWATFTLFILCPWWDFKGKTSTACSCCVILLPCEIQSWCFFTMLSVLYKTKRRPIWHPVFYQIPIGYPLPQQY